MWTNRGKEVMFEEFFEASSVSTDFRLQLASATVPTGQTEWGANVSNTSQVVLVSALTPEESSIVNPSGLIVIRSTTSTSGFDVSSGVELGLSAARAVLVTTGDRYQFSGTITGARYVLLTESKTPTGTFVANDAEIYAWWDIGVETNITEGNTLTITNLSLQAN